MVLANPKASKMARFSSSSSAAAAAAGGARAAGLRIPQKNPPAIKGVKSNPKTTKGKAALALRLAKGLARRAEIKVNTYVLQNQDMFTGTKVWDMNQIGQGDGINQRTGLNVNYARLDLRLRLTTFVQSNVTYRVIVLQDL